MIVREARSWEEYLSAWEVCMQGVYWFRETHFFDYTREEESRELEKEFEEQGNIFLMALDPQPVGVIGISVSGDHGTIRRYEPAIREEYMEKSVGKILLAEGMRRASQRGVRTLRTTLRFPYHAPIPWQADLFRDHGFVDGREPGVQLMADLNPLDPEPIDMETTACDEFSLEEVARFVLRAFTGTPEDRAIHEKDHNVTRLGPALETLRDIWNGRYGKTSPKFRRVVLMDGGPVGFVISFIPEPGSRRPHGTIGCLGVFPEYRRRGIATKLVDDTLWRLKGHGCRYAYVGTPKRNYKAIRLYEKLGFTPIFKIYFFVKQIN
jgi:ribosomal protein S18 acetylase RimI-like enzyme